MNNKIIYPKAGLGSRLYALFYDSLIVFAIEVFAAGLVVASLKALVGTGLISYGEYSGASNLLGTHPVWSSVYTFYLGAIWVGFFVYYWTTRGQTPGMRAWKLKVQNADGSLITITQALIRIGTSAFGLANFTVPFDPKKRGFHDIWAKTEIIVLPHQSKY